MKYGNSENTLISVYVIMMMIMMNMMMMVVVTKMLIYSHIIIDNIVDTWKVMILTLSYVTGNVSATKKNHFFIPL